MHFGHKGWQGQGQGWKHGKVTAAHRGNLQFYIGKHLQIYLFRIINLNILKQKSSDGGGVGGDGDGGGGDGGGGW